MLNETIETYLKTGETLRVRQMGGMKKAHGTASMGLVAID
jgi:hypothetical protein